MTAYGPSPLDAYCRWYRSVPRSLGSDPIMEALWRRKWFGEPWPQYKPVTLVQRTYGPQKLQAPVTHELAMMGQESNTPKRDNSNEGEKT